MTKTISNLDTITQHLQKLLVDAQTQPLAAWAHNRAMAEWIAYYCPDYARFDIDAWRAQHHMRYLQEAKRRMR